MKLETIGRLLAIALGIASAVLLAHSGFGIRFNEEFLLFLKLVENTVGFVVLPFELLLVEPAIRWLREQSLIFDLYPHWKNVFVLLWLFFAAEKRAFSSLSLLAGNEGPLAAALAAFRWMWAALVALIGGCFAGTVSLDHPAVLWWAVAAWFLLRGGDGLIYPFREQRDPARAMLGLAFALLSAALALGWVVPVTLAGEPPLFWWAVAAYFAYQLAIALFLLAVRAPLQPWPGLLYPFIIVASVLEALGLLTSPAWLDFSGWPSPGLANLAAFIVAVTAWYFVWALLVTEKRDNAYLVRLLSDNYMRTALDVFTVLGSAATIVYIGRVLA
jgi:hypothetical protein